MSGLNDMFVQATSRIGLSCRADGSSVMGYSTAVLSLPLELRSTLRHERQSFDTTLVLDPARLI